MTSEHAELVGALEAQPSQSSVRIEMNAKGQVQPKVACYEGVTPDEMQRLLDLAVDTMAAAVNKINQSAVLNTP